MKDNEKIKNKGSVAADQSKQFAEKRCVCQAEDAVKVDVKAEKHAISSLDDQVKVLQEQLDSCQVSQQEWKDKCMRVIAELENFKKRMAKEQRIWIDTAQANMLRELLGIVDDFDRAMREQKKIEVTPEVRSWIDGLIMIHAALRTFLINQGVQEIPTDIPFDPKFHEALMQVDSEEHESGEIVSVLQTGYLFNDTVLRPAKVSVAK